MPYELTFYNTIKYIALLVITQRAIIYIYKITKYKI